MMLHHRDNSFCSKYLVYKAFAGQIILGENNMQNGVVMIQFFS